MTDRGARPTSRWPWLVPGAVGLAVGIVLGVRWVSFPEEGEFIFSPAAGFLMIVVLVLGGAGVLGLLLATFRSTRPIGVTLLVALATTVIGLPIGTTIGPRPLPARQQQGTLEVAFSQPVMAPVTVPAICRTIKNGGTIAEVGTADPFRVGVDQVTLTVDVGDPGSADVYARGSAIEIASNRWAFYHGPVPSPELGIESRTGHGSFTAEWDNLLQSVEVPGTIGLGTPVAPAVVGSLSWQCTSDPAPTRDPASPLAAGSGGRIALHGIVELAACSSDDVCPALGRTDVACSAAPEARFAVSETVVPWPAGRRARLRFEPEQGDVTLTVELSDGATFEARRAATNVVEVPVPIGHGYGFTATFALPDGHLTADVTWACPNRGD
jgi:hypothetical protein